jgi:hypothetical protein
MQRESRNVQKMSSVKENVHHALAAALIAQQRRPFAQLPTPASPPIWPRFC